MKLGHTLDRKMTVKPYEVFRHGGQNVQIFDSSTFVPGFIVQDDSGGPFRFIEIIRWDDAAKRGLVTKEAADGYERQSLALILLDGATLGTLDGLMVPLPQRVTLDGFRAQETAVELVRQTLIRGKQLAHDQLVFRTFLQPSNRTKEQWGAEALPIDVAIALRRCSLPHWVWVTEFANRSDLEKNQTILGQVIQDSSGRGSRSKWDDVISFVTPKEIYLSEDSRKEYVVRDRLSFSGQLKQFSAH